MVWNLLQSFVSSLDDSTEASVGEFVQLVHSIAVLHPDKQTRAVLLNVLQDYDLKQVFSNIKLLIIQN